MNALTELLQEIVNNPRPSESTLAALLELGSDGDRYLVTVSRAGFIGILRQFERGELAATALKNWASRLVEHKNIGFEFGDEGVLEEAIFQLAHDEIYGLPDLDLCRHIEAMLERRGPHRKPN